MEMNVKQAGEYLGVCTARVNGLVRAGLLKPCRAVKWARGFRYWFKVGTLSGYDGHRLRALLNHPGRFKKGEPTRYRHPKGFRASKGSEFKRGRGLITGRGETAALTPKPHIRERGGLVERYVYTRLNEKRRVFNKGSGKWYRAGVRTGWARVVYGLEGIPSGHVIYHIDGDAFNNSPGNLELISRAELLKRNRSGR